MSDVFLVNDTMISKLPIIILFSVIVLVQANSDNSHSIVRNKRDNASNTTDDNPCSPYDRTMPDFQAPGRRVSAIKCYEFLWELNYRATKEKRQKECRDRSPTKAFFHSQVYGGRITEPGEFPHMGAIGWKAVQGTWIFKCGSSLISPNFILTAAHCSKASSRDTTVAELDPKIVRLGDKNIIDVPSDLVNPIDAKIIKIIVHPLYASPKKYNDIALMKLEKAVEFGRHVRPACIWSNTFDYSFGTEATVTGWGEVESAGKTTSPELQAAVLDVIDSRKCDELLRRLCSRLWCGVRDDEICAGKLAGGVDTCQGDSGGPLQVKIPIPPNSLGSMHFVIGVTSFGAGCAIPNTPGVYTRVSAFIDWIEGIVWK